MSYQSYREWRRGWEAAPEPPEEEEMSRPIMCDDCGCPIEKPTISFIGEGITLKVDRKSELCLDCVLLRIKRVMGLEDIDPEDITEEMYEVEA